MRVRSLYLKDERPVYLPRPFDATPVHRYRIVICCLESHKSPLLARRLTCSIPSTPLVARPQRPFVGRALSSAPDPYERGAPSTSSFLRRSVYSQSPRRTRCGPTRAAELHLLRNLAPASLWLGWHTSDPLDCSRAGLFVPNSTGPFAPRIDASRQPRLLRSNARTCANRTGPYSPTDGWEDVVTRA